MAAEEFAAGKARRKTTPRAAHAEPGVVADKRDIISILEHSNADRLEQLIPVRHSRMVESPFAFFRGSAAIQAADLARTPDAGITVQACGDCHLMNFGGFATPERNLVFDINDFDETFPAPWEWDLKRLTVSLVLAARWHRFSSATASEAVMTAASKYREAMQDYARQSTMAVWYSRVAYVDILERARTNQKATKILEADMRRAQKQTSEHVFQNLTVPVGGAVRIKDQPPLIYHPRSSDLDKIARDFLEKYAVTLREDYRSLFGRFRYADIAIKVVGVGSVGTRCFVALFLGEHDDPLFLQIKEARKSVLEPYTSRSPWKHEGERVVAGQRLMQAVSDIFLGWARGPRGRDFYIRQLRDMKVSADLDALNAENLVRYGGLCGATLARAHAKAGQASRIAGYLGSSTAFDEALDRYAKRYADQVERDHEVFQNAVRNGQIKTETSTTPIEVAIS